MTLYFAAAALASLRLARRQAAPAAASAATPAPASRLEVMLGHTVPALFAAVGTAACVVDTVNWGVLYPTLVTR